MWYAIVHIYARKWCCEKANPGLPPQAELLLSLYSHTCTLLRGDRQNKQVCPKDSIGKCCDDQQVERTRDDGRCSFIPQRGESLYIYHSYIGKYSHRILAQEQICWVKEHVLFVILINIVKFSSVEFAQLYILINDVPVSYLHLCQHRVHKFGVWAIWYVKNRISSFLCDFFYYEWVYTFIITLRII